MVEEVDAKVVDNDVQILGEAGRWLAETAQTVAAKVTQYEVYPIETYEQYKQAKKDRAAVRRDKAELDAQRMSMTRTVEDAIKQFKSDVKNVLDPLVTIDEGIKGELDAFEEMERQRKRAELQQAFEDAAPDIAIPMSDDRPLVSLDKVIEVFGQGTLGKKWMLFSTPEAVAEEQLMAALALIADGERTIDETVQEEDRAAVKAAYFSTLDIQAALTEARNIKAQRERLAALEAERKAREEEAEGQEETHPIEQEEPQPVEHEKPRVDIFPSLFPVPSMPTPQQKLLDDMAVQAAQPTYGTETPPFVLFAYVDNSQRDGLVAYCKQHGIKGAFRPTFGRKFVLIPAEEVQDGV